jgi:putative photosynthetic complex assembly protein
MSYDHHTASFPRIPLYLCGSAILIALVAATAGRLTNFGDVTPHGTPVIERSLRFADRANGAVAVYDARDPSQPIEIVAPETNGFLRATMRGLAQQRIRQDANLKTPFVLAQWPDNRLTLEDPTTHRLVDMEAFGVTNEAVFAKLLTAKARS